ncbi:mycocerosic acid synthase-like polyketide synthase [Streptomyces xanthochromogenes]|uniref:type I polyketide synthase n=1 Tax=Streptomyces xanthochromogenes TaxID=67384 RepID=UPI0016721D0E|nr:type I polyketide synthase [Streptomyces xanthochromogenes]GHB71866.1 mycocerosic acid synthase-like polyketide synthase [Streptomyces xanthochromogenes]
MSETVDMQLPEGCAEPVAVVGAACRLPGGVDSLAGLWRLLEEERETVRTVPEDRWDLEVIAAGLPDEVARRLRFGGFLDGDLGAFDAQAFGISGAEATWLDPQHRLLLMVVWEAIEHSGIPVDRLRGTQTGVFSGMYAMDNYLRGHRRPQESEAYWYSGGMHGVGVGRVSYLLDLHGPSISVDTACSSSLVAVHLACQALRAQECQTALAGGVSAGLGPELGAATSRWDMLSPTGRCHAFGADADGYLRAEGCGVVVLKLLKNAVRDGDRILAVLRGSAVNQDGRSIRLTAPSSQAQAAVFSEALRVSGVRAGQVGMIEAHGAGTAVGDPLEFTAANQVYGAGDQPCALGSIKTNIGHTEPASGVVGLLKAIVSLRQGKVPATLHFNGWNPQIDATGSRLFVPTSLQPWPVTEGPRTAAVSSYGVGGTNAHMIVEEAPAPKPSPPRPVGTTDDSELRTYLVSAGSPQALATTAGRIADWIEGEGREVPLVDVAHTLATRRSHGPSRAGVVAASRDQLVDRLRACAAGETGPGIATGTVIPAGPGPVFVYSGHGSQWSGMTQGLLDHDAAFTRVIDELEPLLQAEGGFSLRQVLKADTVVTGVQRVQPTLFAVQLALTAMWREAGVEPSAVIGHSMGEVAAAVTCGALSTSDGVKVICRRAGLLTRVAGGAMAAVRLPAEQVGSALAESRADCVEVAVIAAPASTVISGDASQVEDLVAQWEQAEVPVARVQVDVASHSPHMDPILDELRDALAEVTPHKPLCRFYTTVCDDPRDEVGLDATYWAFNQRRPVKFSAAVAAAASDGHTQFIEVNVHPLLAGAITATLGDTQAAVVPTVRRDGNERLDFATHLAAAHTTGLALPWDRLYRSGTLADLPGTCWAPEHLWIPNNALADPTGGTDTPQSTGHPLLGYGIADPAQQGRRLWQAEVSAPLAAWLAEHRVGEVPVMPGAAWCEMALTAAAQTLTPSAGSVRVQDVTFDSLLVLDPDHRPQLNAQTQLQGTSARFEVLTRTPNGTETHAHATLIPAPELPPAVPLDITDLDRDYPVEVDLDSLRTSWQTSCSVTFGPAFRPLRSVSLHTGSDKPDALARLVLPDTVRALTKQFTWHPVLLDGCLQTLLVQWTDTTDLPAGHAMPDGIGALQVYGDTSKGVYARARAESIDRRHVTGTVDLYDADGQLVARVEKIRFTHVPKQITPQERLGKYLNGVRWEGQQLAAAPRTETRWLAVTEGAEPAWHEQVLADLATQSAVTRLPVPLGMSPSAVEDTIRGAFDTSEPFTDILLMPTEAPGQALATTVPETAQHRVERALTAIRCLAHQDQPARLHLLTCCGQGTQSAETIDLAQSGLSGLLRVAAYEHPDMHPALCDTDTVTAPADIARQLLADDPEDQVAWRSGTRHVARLAPTPLSPDDLPTTLCRPDQTPLAADGTRFTRIPDPASTAHTVDISVTVTCPPPPDLRIPLSAIAGTTTGSGAEPRTVAALVPAGMPVSRVTAERRWTVPVPAPEHATATAASLLPYLAAHLAVHRLARVTSGENVLIRGQRTPILTALQYTAEAARTHVTLQMPDQEQAPRTASPGLSWDVIFDVSSDGPPDAAGQPLTPGGRHIAVTGTGQTAAPAPHNALACRLDVPAVLESDPDCVAEALTRIAADLAEQRLPFLPHTGIDLAESLSNDSNDTAGEQTVALLWPAGPVPVALPPDAARLIRPDGAYLVTGGLGGLGLKIAVWLARRGAGTIILNSRSQPTHEATALIDSLRREGHTIEAIAADVAEPGTAETLCTAAERHGHQLRGVLHAAAVVDDAAITNVTPDLLNRVWRPKATGAWLLHHASKAYDLDWWVAFSSFVPQAGSPGQSAYAAASAWLDELVTHRWSAGLPALGINWGAWAEVGIGARTIGSRGFETVPLDDAFEGLELLLCHDRPRNGFISMDLARWLEPYPQTARLPFYTDFLHDNDQQAAPDGGDAQAARIITAPADQRSGLLTDFITQQAADVLRCSPDRIGAHASLTALGMDSMITVQLRNRLQKAFDITIPRVILWTKPTVTSLRNYVLERLPAVHTAPPTTEDTTRGDS